MSIELSSLRDRRPKSQPIEYKTSKGNVVKFQNPMKGMKGRKGLREMKRAAVAEQNADIEVMFEIYAIDGTEALDKILEDEDDATMEDLMDIIMAVATEVRDQSGDLGESKA